MLCYVMVVVVVDAGLVVGEDKFVEVVGMVVFVVVSHLGGGNVGE